jgi:hypothetical protein
MKDADRPCFGGWQETGLPSCRLVASGSHSDHLEVLRPGRLPPAIVSFVRLPKLLTASVILVEGAGAATHYRHCHRAAGAPLAAVIVAGLPELLNAAVILVGVPELPLTTVIIVGLPELLTATVILVRLPKVRLATVILVGLSEFLPAAIIIDELRDDHDAQRAGRSFSMPSSREVLPA